MNSRRRFLRSAAALAAGSLCLNGKAIGQLALAETPGKLKAAALKPGDTIAISSPAGAVWDFAQVETFATILKGFGFKVVPGNTLREKYGYFAGTDAFRAKELNGFFADPRIKGIFCMKGGWGCARILDQLDFAMIAQNPKVLIGFSDITSLLIAITAKTGLLTFHGPVGNSGWNAWTSGIFRNVVMEPEALPVFSNPSGEEPFVTINPGKASGTLMGGNLTVLSALMGSSYLPDWKGRILFLEEVKEEPYSIDRMLTQLRLCGVLNVISGFVFGTCAKCLAEEPQKAFTFQEVLEQHLKPLGIPAFYGAMIGHIENKLTVPLGADAEMDADKGTIRLLETAVV